jgi:hypothetical protein
VAGALAVQNGDDDRRKARSSQFGGEFSAYPRLGNKCRDSRPSASNIPIDAINSATPVG